MDIKQIIKDKAKEKKRKIMITEGWDERVLEAVDRLIKEDIVEPILVGKEEDIKSNIKKLKLDINPEIIDPDKYEDKETLIKSLVEIRKHKGMTEEKATELINDLMYFSFTLFSQGFADGIAGSCVYSTADFMRPAFQILGKRKDVLTVSEVAMIIDKKQDRMFFISDASLNISPNENELAQIAINAGDCVKSLGIEPVIGMLSFSTKGSGENPILEPIRKAIDIVKEQRPDYHIEGELQGDAAINPDAAKRKCPDSEYAGKVNTLIFPNLTASNITVHLLKQFMGKDMELVCGFYVGMDKPISLMGRSSDADMIYHSILMCAAQANMFG